VLDRGAYEARGLTDTYKLIVDPTAPAHQRTTDAEIYWRIKSRDAPAVTKLPEAPLWRLERELARRDPDTYDYIQRPPATATKKRRSVRPVSADTGAGPGGGGGGPGGSTLSRRRASTFSPRSTFATELGDERQGRRSTAGLEKKGPRSKSRARSVEWDRETEIRENMPHRKEKDKAWWEGRR
jgi:hypothetical protein